MSEYRKTNPLLYGNQNASRKLNVEDVAMIRNLYFDKQQRKKEIRKEIEKLKKEYQDINSRITLKSLAEKFEVSKPAIERVVSFQTWRHVL
jgi:tRNA G26 N,N-dimethylase Trm1